MSQDAQLIAYITRLGDNALVLGQRKIEVVTLGPELEEELANANFALDYIGQARLFYSLAAELEAAGRDEDALAFLRSDHEYQNLLLLEQPNGDFGDMLVRDFLFESFYLLQLEVLENCKHQRLAEIAARAAKEIRYHLRHASLWMIRLGDGTPTSRARVQASLQRCWRFTGELFAADAVDRDFMQRFAGPDLDAIAHEWRANVAAVLQEATLKQPDDGWMASGGKQGRHSEHFGYMLAELQHLQRSHPGASW